MGMPRERAAWRRGQVEERRRAGRKPVRIAKGHWDSAEPDEPEMFPRNTDAADPASHDHLHPHSVVLRCLC